MITTVTADGYVCDCCANLADSGDDSGCRFYHGDHADTLLTGFDLSPRDSLVIGDRDENVTFSWTRCDGCNALPGSRFSYVILTALRREDEQ